MSKKKTNSTNDFQHLIAKVKQSKYLNKKRKQYFRDMFVLNC